MRLLLLYLLLFCIGSTFRLQALEASLDMAAFRGQKSPYLEIYLEVEAAGLHHLQLEGKRLKATVEVLLLIRRQGQVVVADRYRLQGPETPVPINFKDLRRYGIPEGSYSVEMELRDSQDTTRRLLLTRDIKIDFGQSPLQQSDILLLGAWRQADSSEAGVFVRNGFHLEPLPSRRYGPRAEQLRFYQEVYGADQVVAPGQEILVRYVLQRPRPQGPLHMLIGHQRHQPAAVIPILGNLAIERLPEGKYELLVEVRRRSGELLSSRLISLDRQLPFLGKNWKDLQAVNLSETFVGRLDSAALDYSLRALTPRLPNQELPMVERWLRRDSLQQQRAYLLAYWVALQPTNPEGAYDTYMDLARKLDVEFQSGFRHGFETDRGYIYLKYGPPQDVYTQEEEPSAPPYEIWTYYDFPQTRQSDVRFLFYNPSLVPGDFQLLHSTALGERNFPQWELELYKDAPNEVDGDFLDGTQMKDNFNRHARRFFQDN